MHDTLEYSGRNIRGGVRTWLAELDLPHALTLNTDRSMILPRLEAIYSQFCLSVDRVIHDRKNVMNVPSADRFLAIAFPEHLETNAHLHAVCDLDPFISKFPGTATATTHLTRIWRQATRGAGSVCLKMACGQGFARYASKRLFQPESPYLLSRDFHPQR